MNDYILDYEQVLDKLDDLSKNTKIKVNIKSSDSPLVAMTKQERKRIWI